ncbi:MAG: ABC transporter substrate-binding protein [Deltaproteobacteria bacterium]|nr:ABC transporter substrate-binding protein [Deltaproteobacteria bacterium]
MVTKRSFWQGIVFVIFCFAINAAAADAPMKLRLGYSVITAGHGVSWVTKETGLFHKNGLDVELLYVSTTLLSQSMLSGGVHIGAGTGIAALTSNLEGSDLVIIASLSTAPSLAYLVSSKEITKPQQLEGKKIGITRLGSTSHLILRMALKEFGIPEKKVTVLQMETSANMLIALQKGNIDAFPTTEEYRFAAERLGFNVLFDLQKLGIKPLGGDVFARRAFIQKNQQAVRRYLRAIVEGVHYYKNHKNASMDILARYMRAKDPKLVEVGYDFYARAYSLKPYPNLAGIKLALEDVAQRNPKAREARPEQFYEARFVKELDESGFIDSLYK